LPIPKKAGAVGGLTSNGIDKPALPFPPEEVFAKQKGPIITPVREPLPKPIHPKELVQLHQAPPPAPPASKIPRIIPPKELVELHPPPPKELPNKEVSRPRNSGASVKDLIKNFEEMDPSYAKQEDSEEALRTMKSIGEWRSKIGNIALNAKPV
jgi:hypothetical protein